MHSDIQFVQAILAKEVPGESEPSQASHTNSIELMTSQVNAVYWLLEEQCTPIVNRHSFTLSHPKQHTFRGKTVATFTHFAWLHSNKTLVFCDMQGSPAHQNGETIEILFDPMTHSPQG
jgi:hypothetical protein